MFENAFKKPERFLCAIVHISTNKWHISACMQLVEQIWHSTKTNRDCLFAINSEINVLPFFWGMNRRASSARSTNLSGDFYEFIKNIGSKEVY